MTPDRLRAVFARLLEAAEKGEPWAVREVLDRTLGKPGQADVLDRLDRLEARMNEQDGGRECKA